MRGICRISLATLAFVAAVPAAAQEDQPVVLEDITITANRADRPIRETPQTVHVIERDEIEKQLQITPNAAQVIAKLIPGYSVPTQSISSASESFRGRDLLVMIDGVPLNTPLRDVARILPMIDLATVERIEVVAGASSLYGSGSTGGTVNFITRKGEGGPRVGVNSSLRFFSADPGNSLAPQLTIDLSGKNGAVDYYFVGSGAFANRTYDGKGREMPSDGLLGQGGGDRFGRGNFFGKVGWDIDDARRLELSASWIYLDQNPDWMTLYSKPFSRPDFTSPYQAASVREDTKSVSLRYTDKDFALGRLSLLGYYNDIEKRFNYSEFDINYNGTVYYSGNLGSPTSPHNQTILRSQRVALNATVDTDLPIVEGAKLTWGVDVGFDRTGQTMTSGRDIFAPMEQVNYAGFAQLQVPIGNRLTLRGGMRYEFFDLTVKDFTRPSAFVGFPGLGYLVLPDLQVRGGSFDYSSPTFNAGATFKLTETSEIYGGFSQGYALPDVGAFTRRAGAMSSAQMLYYGCYLGAGPLPPVAYTCNKNLSTSFADLAPKAQLVNAYELGIRGSWNAFRGNLTGFVSTSDEGVSFNAATNTITQQKEIVYGVEFSGEYAVNENLTVGTNLTWREGRYDSDRDGKIDAYLPNNRIATPFRGSLYGSWVFDTGTRVALETQFWSGRKEFDGTAIYPIEAGFTLNASLSHPLAGGTAYLSGENLLDAAYENPSATATRNLPVNGLGRTITLGFSKTF